MSISHDPNIEESPEVRAKDPFDLDNPALSTRINRLSDIDNSYRSYFEREWFRNCLFYAGRQWVIFDSRTQRWRPKRLPPWFPTPFTNKFAEKTNDLVAAFLQGGIPIRYQPATNDPEDIATAETGERIREVFYEEAEIDSFKMELGAWIVLTGNGFLHPYYDYDTSHGEKDLIKCQICKQHQSPQDFERGGKTCPECNRTGVQPHQYFEDVKIPLGRFRTNVLSPFEVFLDPRIRHMKNQRRTTVLQTYDLELAKDMWPKFADEIKADKEQRLGQIYLDSLAYVTSSFGGTASASLSGTGAPGDKFEPRVTIYKHYELPSEKYPDGLTVTRVGKNRVVEAGVIENRWGAGNQKGKPYIPLAHFGMDVIPGRFWGKTRMDDLVGLQVFRNLIDANLKLTVQRTGNPMWLNPTGSGIVNLTGEPGQKLDYNPVSLGGTTFAKPERIGAELGNLQPLMILKKQIDDEMERVAGTLFLAGSDTPAGVTAASALAYLGERAEKAISPFKKSTIRSWKSYEEMSLEIARQHFLDDRFKVIAGKNKRWEVEKFKLSDLKGAVNMKIDDNALFPKSNATQRATIAQLIQLGVINPVDPNVAEKILIAFGESALRGSTDLDEKEAVKEWDKFLEKDQMPQLIPLVQNSLIHLKQHADAAKTDEFHELPPEKQKMWIEHIHLTVSDIMARQTAMQPIDPSEAEPDGSQEAGGAKGKKSSSSAKKKSPSRRNSRPAPVQKGEDLAAIEKGAQLPLEPTPPGEGEGFG